ncbi:MAG: glycogen debranching protein GlgX, partial [Verrucomicrobiota bacterium]|nr:glycogen debranching protein GlgX [Verrucomicrobiota bacterium]
IYEASVRGYTQHESAHVQNPGTYKGLIEKIPYLKELGITAVELLPTFEFNEMEYFWQNDRRKNLRNFWGYSTVAFFAPNGRFAASGNQMGAQVREFKEMVLEMHKAGIEVILDVVFNHTAENGMGGQTYSFRGIDNPAYYMLEEDAKAYKNFTGCGNTVNCNHPAVRDFIVDCLHYWVIYMHVDGFRFDLASILTRARNGDVLENPPVVERIADDPVLRGVKIIAEAWDAAGLYQVGSFPNARWSEWNGRFRDDIREFWNGTAGMLSTFATRLCGSTDLYEFNGLSILKSINFVTSHDGFTLMDVVSYNEKHNLDNCEDNNDGDNNNHSYNFGTEGPSNDPQILAFRLRRLKNLLGTLFLSQGVPMLLAGDEFGRTQRGNNNAYCQDNDTSWVDWTLLEKNKELLEYTKKAIALRRNHPALQRADFFNTVAPEGDVADIVWFGPEGTPEPDWKAGTAMACRIDGRKIHTGAQEDDNTFFLIFNNGATPRTFELPAAPAKWTLALSSQEEKPKMDEVADRRLVTIDANSLNVFISE